MGDGGTNDVVNGVAADPADGEPEHSGPRELSRVAATAATVLAVVFGCAVLLAVFHWLGWTVPWIGWIVAKAGIKLTVGGFAVLAVASDWLRTRLRPRSGA